MKPSVDFQRENRYIFTGQLDNSTPRPAVRPYSAPLCPVVIIIQEVRLMARGKSLAQFCHHCGRESKMEMVGAVENQPDRVWYRCTRCRHASLIDLAVLRQKQEDAHRKLERSDCSEYRPEDTYAVGQAIHHTEWDDIGKIVSKVRTSDGHHAIVVTFERLGERRLLESVIQSAEAGE
jgi:hypothetical protein